MYFDFLCILWLADVLSIYLKQLWVQRWVYLLVTVYLRMLVMALVVALILGFEI